MTTELDDARRELVDARAEKAELDQLVEGLEERVREGEEEQVRNQLEEQWGVRRLAQLRHEAAVRRVENAEKAAREEHAREAVETARRELSALSVDVVGAAYARALSAVYELVELGEARHDRARHHCRQFVDLGLDAFVLDHHRGGRTVIEVDGVQYTNDDSIYQARHLVDRLMQELRDSGYRRDKLARSRRQATRHPVVDAAARASEAA